MASAWGSSWGSSWGASWGSISDVVKTGTGGIDPGAGAGIRRRRIVKPTGILHLPVKARPSVKERIDESRGIAAEVAGRIASEFAEETAAIETRQQVVVPPIVTMSLEQINAEIGFLLRKKLRTEEEELMILLLMAAAAS